MRKALEKIALGCAATMALSAVLSASAFAATGTDSTSSISFDSEKGAISFTETFLTAIAEKGETTVLVYGNVVSDTDIQADEIEYINQDDAKTTSTFTDMGLRNGIQTGITYTVKVGGEQISEEGIQVFTFKIDEGGQTVTFMWGDVDQSGGVDALDASAIVDSMIGGTKTYGNYTIAENVNDTVIWGDVDTSGGVDALDASAIVDSMIGGTKTFGEYTIGEEATVTVTSAE